MGFLRRTQYKREQQAKAQKQMMAESSAKIAEMNGDPIEADAVLAKPVKPKGIMARLEAKF